MSVSAQVLRAVDHLHRGEGLFQPGDDLSAVGIHHDLLHFRYVLQGGEDVLVERFAVQQAVVLAGDALRMMAHGNEGGDAGQAQWLILR